MKTIKDRLGREIRENDILKVFHYRGALRRKKHFMYKWVLIRDGEYFASHLQSSNNLLEEGFYLWPQAKDGILTDTEIVQRAKYIPEIDDWENI